MDVKGNRVDVKVNRVDVKGHSVDVKGNNGDVKGDNVDVKGNIVGRVWAVVSFASAGWGCRGGTCRRCVNWRATWRAS